MPRRLLIYSKSSPYHITARVNNRESFPGDLHFVWKTTTTELFMHCFTHGIQVQAFVLMPNHFHLIVTSPNIPISKFMREFMSSCTRIINIKNRRTGHLFGGRYHWTIIDNSLYYAHALKYVYRNPVKAKICKGVADYPFSTISGLLGRAYLPVPIEDPSPEYRRMIFKEGSLGTLEDWLNKPHRAEETAAIQKALKRKIFKLPVDRNTRKLFTLC